MILLALKSIAPYRINSPWPFQSDSLGLHEIKMQDAYTVYRREQGNTVIHVLLKLSKQQV